MYFHYSAIKFVQHFLSGTIVLHSPLWLRKIRPVHIYFWPVFGCVFFFLKPLAKHVKHMCCSRGGWAHMQYIDRAVGQIPCMWLETGGTGSWSCDLCYIQSQGLCDWQVLLLSSVKYSVKWLLGGGRKGILVWPMRGDFLLWHHCCDI